MNVYQLPASINARAKLAAAQEKVATLKGQVRNGVGQAKTAALVTGGAYGAARLSAQLGGPEGAKVLGLDLPLVMGGACALLSMSGMAGEHSEDVLAVGVGALAGYAAQKGFNHGMESHKPKAAVSGVEIGMHPAPGYVPTYYPHVVGAPLDERPPEDVLRQFAEAPTPVEDAAA